MFHKLFTKTYFSFEIFLIIYAYINYVKLLMEKTEYTRAELNIKMMHWILTSQHNCYQRMEKAYRGFYNG